MKIPKVSDGAKVRIVSDGTRTGTHVYDEIGKEFWYKSLTFHHDETTGYPIVTMSFYNTGEVSVNGAAAKSEGLPAPPDAADGLKLGAL